MKVLVTGGCGFIGSHVCDLYVESGYDVVIVDNLSTGKMENRNPEAKFYQIDILDDRLEEVFLSERPEVVNHHAAQISVPLSVLDPIFDAKTNIEGTLRLLELSKKYGVRKFIFASTGGAIYGDTLCGPADEEMRENPKSPYAISKLASEKYISFYASEHGIDYAILRYSNVYGPRQTPHGEAGVVPIFIEKLLLGEQPCLYHFPEKPEGMIRDYVYVKDAASANLLVTQLGKTGIFNVSTGVGTQTLDLYKLIVATLKKRGVYVKYYEPKRASARPGDLKVSILSPEKAKSVLGWIPEKNLEEGIRETIDWYLNDKDRVFGNRNIGS